MAGVDELDLDAVGDRHRPLVADRLQQRHRARSASASRVERQRRRVLRVAVAVRALRIFFLDPPGVGQHDAAEVLGAGVQKMRPRKPCGDEPRQVAAVIEMRVRQHDGVDRVGGATGSGCQLRSRSSFSPWKSPQSTSTRWPAGVEQMLRAGDGARRTEKRADSCGHVRPFTRRAPPARRCARRAPCRSRLNSPRANAGDQAGHRLGGVGGIEEERFASARRSSSASRRRRRRHAVAVADEVVVDVDRQPAPTVRGRAPSRSREAGKRCAGSSAVSAGARLVGADAR